MASCSPSIESPWLIARFADITEDDVVCGDGFGEVRVSLSTPSLLRVPLESVRLSPLR
jgi:hypothetical protein